jgi:hypothetical protein
LYGNHPVILAGKREKPEVVANAKISRNRNKNPENPTFTENIFLRPARHSLGEGGFPNENSENVTLARKREENRFALKYTTRPDCAHTTPIFAGDNFLGKSIIKSTWPIFYTQPVYG